MAIRILSTESVDGGITGNNIRTNTGNLFVGNGSNTTANIYGFGDSLMIQGVSGATYLRVSGTATLSGTLQAGQYILATGLAYGAVNNYTQIIDGSTGAISGTSATFSSSVDISSAGSAHFSITNTNVSGASQTYYQYVGSNGDYVFRNVTDSTTPFFLEKNNNASFNGNLGVGGQATGKLDVYGSAGGVGVRIRGSAGAGNHYYGFMHDGTDLQATTQTNIFYAGGAIAANTTITDFASLRIDTPSVAETGAAITNNYAIYQASSLQKNYFGGNVEIVGSTTLGSASFIDTTAGQTVVTSEGAYAANGSVKLYEAKRSGGAVAGDWSYDDATTDMSLGTNTNHNFSIKTNNSRVLNVTNTGRVGIGVSPSYKLQILETGGATTNIGVYSNVQGNGTNNYSFYADATQGTSTNFAFYAASGESAFLNDVGIGTDAPTSILDVRENANNKYTAYFYNSATDANAHGVNIQTATTSATAYAFRVNSGSNSNALTVMGDAKVGISTASPTRQLHILNSSGDNRGIMVENTVAASYAEVQVKAASEYRVGTGGSSTIPNGEFYVYDATAGAHRFDIDSAGNVRIGGNTSINGAFGASNTVVSIKGRTSGGEGILQLTGLGNQSTDIVSRIEFHSYAEADPMCSIRAVRGNADDVGDLEFYTNSGGGAASKRMLITSSGKVGIGENDPSYELEIGGTNNPKVAIVSAINSATSSLYFGDSDAKDRGQIVYTHFGDFMELKTGGNTRVYLESGINTAYTSDGLYNANATPSYWSHGNAQFKLGYMDNGSGLYSGAYSFNVKSTDGIPVTGREIGAIYVRDTSNNRMPLIISNQGRININQTNTSTGLASTGWIDIQNGTGAYNFYNYYTGTDGFSGCARYRVDNTSPSFFDFYYSTTQVGYITTNGTDIFYANTSDYRLKEDLKDFNGISLLEQIQVYDFKWKESDNRMYGVVAHELQEIVPQAVVGNKDEEKLQAVDYSKLVPVLIKSIQELEARVKELENK